MLKTYAKFILLLGVVLCFSSCSLFKTSKVEPTVSVDDLLQEDIESSGEVPKNNISSSEDLEEELNLLEEDDDEFSNTSAASSDSSNDELSLEEDSDFNASSSAKEDKLSVGDEGELSLEDEDQLSVEDEGELSLEDEDQLSVGDEGELSLEDEDQLSAEDEDELSLEDELESSQDVATSTSKDNEENLKDNEENLKDNEENLKTEQEETENFATTTLQDIKYKQTKGSEIVSIEAKDKLAYSTRFNSKNNQLVIEIKNAVLPEKLKRPYFMKDFSGGSVVAVNAYQNSPSSTANIILQLRNGANQSPQIVNRGSSLEIRYPLDGESLANNANNKQNTQTSGSDHSSSSKKAELGSLADFFLGGGSYYGHPISLQFEAVPVRQVISYIASEVGANILVDEGVQGKISLKLRDIPWDQALALILKSKGLGYIKEKGGVLRISSLSKLEKEEKALVAILESKKKLTPLSVKVMPISFAKASQLATKLKVFLTPKRGAVSSDERSNTLIITDTLEILKKISLLVKNLDQAPSQVSIEAKFIEASQSFSKNLGVNWSFTGGAIDINGLQGVNGPVSLGFNSGKIQPIPAESLSSLTGAIGLTLGSFKFLGDLSSILAIAEQDQMVKVISTPTVVVLDKQKASITNKGENLSITRTESEGTVTESIVRTPITLQLDVSPQIAADGNIVLDVNMTREFAGGAISVGSNARPINSRVVKSKVLIKNGDTLVIGGIFQKDTTKGNSGVPFLSKLPFFGWLFKYQTDTEAKNELMVFLTPKIL